MRRLNLLCLLVLLAGCLWPAPAWAYISHWDPKQSFFIRQFAYLFFALAMLFFVFTLKQEKLQNHHSFRLLAWAAVFFALWNLDCFIGQFLGLYLNPEISIPPRGLLAASLPLTTPAAWAYYLTKLDHLLLVPAFFLFYRGMKRFARDAAGGGL